MVDKIISSNLQGPPMEAHFQTYSGWLQSAGLKLIREKYIVAHFNPTFEELPDDLPKN